MNVKLIIFDLDGTLINTLPDIHGSLNRTLQAFDYPEQSLDQTKAHVGDGIESLLLRSAGDPNADVAQLRTWFRQDYRQHLVNTSAPYPGVEATLTALQTRSDLLMAVLTNKMTEPSKAILERLGLSHFFTHILGPDAYGAHKPDPDGIEWLMEHHQIAPEHTVMVGDGEADLMAAKSAKVRAIAVSYGYRDADSLLRYAPIAVIDRFEAILDVI
ncbi:MAG: HAD family hydrolase [Candidatus Margulisiibacteriota bacterium]